MELPDFLRSSALHRRRIAINLEGLPIEQMSVQPDAG